MAELALPLIGLGALYVLSNKKPENNRSNETFTNMGRNTNNLPNTAVPNNNYPIPRQPIDRTSDNYTRQYINENKTTDKFFNSNIGLANKTDAQINKEFKSLSGNDLTEKNFKHNNMVPYFGSKVTGPQSSMHSNTILDNYQGSGSQNIKKAEQAPLFKPEDNVQWSHGVPNNTDFMQSRQLPSTKMANVLPWEQEKVGPGIGLGYTTEGAGGFNSGMLDREAWQPPTVDELRVVTNPKVTYGLEGHQGPAHSEVQNLPIQGKVEKNRPDTDFALGPQRWLTTTGSSLGQTQKPEQMMGHVNSCSTEYYGHGGTVEGEVSYVKGHNEEPHKQQLCSLPVTVPAAQGQGTAGPNDYSIKGYNIPKNNRLVSCESQNNGAMGGINSTFKAMVAPIMDALRPGRKENVIYNANQLGNIQSAVPNLPLTNPNDKPKTTNKEMTADKVGLNYLNVSHVAGTQGGYQSTDIQVRDQQRNVGDSSTSGNIGNTSSTNAQMNVSAWNEQRNNENKTYQNWPMAGGTQIFQPNANVQIAKRDSDRVTNRLQCENFVQQNQPVISASIPSAETYGKINMPQQYDTEINSNRINPDILSAFKNNPYAQSLNSF